MTKPLTPKRLLILDIDGLRRDVFLAALGGGKLNHLARLLGGSEAETGLHLDAYSPAPSVTFCCQTTIFTGCQPDQHGIVGNQFFDRFGRHQPSRGAPRFYAFDIGDTLAVDDAVRVFTGKIGLMGEILPPNTPTIYEIAAVHGRTSVVANNMIARGATHWIRPSLADIGRFTKGGGLLGITGEEFDGKMVEKTIDYLRQGGRPDILTLYFMGLDHHSHEHGPAAQMDYLERVVDRLVGVFIDELEQLDLLDDTLAVIVSDHGQVNVVEDDDHSLRIGFPFDREMGYLFDALQLDLHDFPGEDPNCDAVVAANGGMAHVYLQNRVGHWADPPRFSEDVVRVAQAFWEANQTGRYAPDLKGALAMILLRDAQGEGWETNYKVYTPENMQPQEAYLGRHPEIETVQAAARLRHLAGRNSGDLVLVSNYADGYYFGSPIKGTHGGLHPGDSRPALSLGWVGGDLQQVEHLRRTCQQVTDHSCSPDPQDCVSLADLMPILRALFGWD
jgi:hypothetical protein